MADEQKLALTTDTIGQIEQRLTHLAARVESLAPRIAGRNKQIEALLAATQSDQESFARQKKQRARIIRQLRAARNQR